MGAEFMGRIIEGLLCQMNLEDPNFIFRPVFVLGGIQRLSHFFIGPSAPTGRNGPDHQVRTA